VKARVKLRGLAAIDMRTVAARQMVAFRDDLVAALGGEDGLSPQRRKLVEMAARVALFLDHIDAWLSEQRSLVNHRSRSVLPALVQRQSLADHLARLLDRLGLDRVPQKVVSLEEYVAAKYSDGPDGAQEPQGAKSARLPQLSPSDEPTGPPEANAAHQGES
jgi:hypothetical protein